MSPLSSVWSNFIIYKWLITDNHWKVLFDLNRLLKLSHVFPPYFTNASVKLKSIKMMLEIVDTLIISRKAKKENPKCSKLASNITGNCLVLLHWSVQAPVSLLVLERNYIICNTYKPLTQIHININYNILFLLSVILRHTQLTTHTHNRFIVSLNYFANLRYNKVYLKTNFNKHQSVKLCK